MFWCFLVFCYYVWLFFVFMFCCFFIVLLLLSSGLGAFSLENINVFESVLWMVLLPRSLSEKCFEQLLSKKVQGPKGTTHHRQTEVSCYFWDGMMLVLFALRSLSLLRFSLLFGPRSCRGSGFALVGWLATFVFCWSLCSIPWVRCAHWGSLLVLGLFIKVFFFFCGSFVSYRAGDLEYGDGSHHLLSLCTLSSRRIVDRSDQSVVQASLCLLTYD